MAEYKWQRRARKYNKKKNGMKISGRSVFTIVEEQVKRARREKVKNEEELTSSLEHP